MGFITLMMLSSKYNVRKVAPTLHRFGNATSRLSDRTSPAKAWNAGNVSRLAMMLLLRVTFVAFVGTSLGIVV
jgi:hypothetical protein